ncbi:hypothetical protein JMK10_17735 [Rhodovulum sulfidophilum]|uniref:hypothetical protein n=1 Tax=Rhodovulum sulfidophilum TaxID=35806 RepID=UPI001923D991|nr:hypothetical protein [Rhodovulum sulfidophilum]MBL3575655.1 hypothetical protein [Rhodovulum sulfidophilum]MCE8431413.1 hypothetical protein [Rhodovulum sulfidophilum]MCF4118594.1 hypothetical protein [Rhodovulum sulfidophilum]
MEHHVCNRLLGAEVTLLLSPEDFMKAAKLASMPLTDANVESIWSCITESRDLYADYAVAVAGILQTLLDEFAYEALFMNPPPDFDNPDDEIPF